MYATLRKSVRSSMVLWLYQTRDTRTQAHTYLHKQEELQKAIQTKAEEQEAAKKAEEEEEAARKAEEEAGEGEEEEEEGEE